MSVGRETTQARRKRMTMRSWRRGIKEMDIILGPFADAQLDRLAPDVLDNYDQLLNENDQDLLQWVTGQVAPPAHFSQLIERIGRFVRQKGGIKSS